MSNVENNEVGGIRDWVNCPVCGETDMPRERDGEGHALISCTNHGCASNGGLNMSALKLPQTPIPSGQELVATKFVEDVALAVSVSRALAKSHLEVEEAEATLEGVAGVAYFLALGVKNEAVALRRGYVRNLTSVTDILRVALANRAHAIHKKAA